MNTIRVLVASIVLLTLAACGSGPMYYDTSRNPGRSSQDWGELVSQLGFKVYPRTMISVINGTSYFIEIEGDNLLPVFLSPGERREIPFIGATPGGNTEIAYFAYEVREGHRTGAVATRVFRLARHGERKEIWVVNRL